MILDATCAPQNIAYPQDVNLLNDARENMEDMIDYLCLEFGYYTPRMYRQNACRDYLNLAKCKKRTAKKIRKAIKQQLQYISAVDNYHERTGHYPERVLADRKKRRRLTRRKRIRIQPEVPSLCPS